MTQTTPNQPAPERPSPRRSGAVDRILGHPLAYLATALLLLAVFGSTFITNPDRVASTKDPAYYTWRTEALVSEDPGTLLDVQGAFDMFAGGYRVAAPVLGGYLREAAGFSSLKVTAFLMVIVPVATALLLGGYAYRQRKDPLIFHVVAIGAASLYLTPPFVGYLDNILCLMFLAAAIWFIGPARDAWGPRIALFIFLLLAGFTHPTTLVIFCLILGAMAVARLLFRRFDLRSVLRDDGPMLLTAFAAAVVTVLIWQIGLWGTPASLGEAALPPPYGSSFFVDRMVLWLDAMRPALNGPLFLIGIVGVLATGRRWVEDDLSRLSIVWLAPLAGAFGFLAGFAYPYYRFFNTTLAWVLLVGLGGYFLIRFFLDRAGQTMFAVGAAVVTLAVGFIFATNLADGFSVQGWNDPNKGWLAPQTRADLDALRGALDENVSRDTPVVFVIDDEDASFQIWGHTKLSGNTSRYGLPREQIDQAYLYLGSLEGLLGDEPTTRGEETYDDLSPALLDESDRAIEASGEEPVVVIASAFNASGANAEIATRERQATEAGEGQVWVVHEGEVTTLDGEPVAGAPDTPPDDPGPLHILLVLVALALLLVPGVIALRGVLPDAEFPEALALAPVLSMALLALAGVIVLAVVRSPFSTPVAWASAVVAALAGAALWFFTRRPARESGRRPAQA
ncbi:MAG: hypothetical protein M3516_00835 [Actinomycetota bacterium]|nr:hypothetical protein [Actinomycetota bacterium]